MTLNDINMLQVLCAEYDNIKISNDELAELLNLAEWGLCLEWIMSIWDCRECPNQAKCDAERSYTRCMDANDYKQDWLDQWRAVNK